MTIRVLICDDQEVVTEGLRTILGASHELEVVGVANDGAQAVEMVAACRPDVVLMDLKMPDMNGIQATRIIHDRFPETRVLVLTTYGADEWVFDAIRAGATGYLLKETPRLQLIEAIKGTANGQTYIDPQVGGKLFSAVAQGMPEEKTLLGQDLDEREREVLRYLARGLSNSEIAEQVHLSPGTVRNIVSAILTKLDVKDRTQAAILALRYGLSK
jgi:two-component system, NarL family, response regulator LiaR